jgi:enoyl-CoA hydratase/carnithine racemase
MSYQHLILDRDGPVATVTINRPEKRNALNSETVDELRRAILALKHDEAARATRPSSRGPTSTSSRCRRP